MFHRKKTYILDENVKMSDDDIAKLNECNIVNSTDVFKKGTKDEVLTSYAKEKGYVIVTKDIRMALRSLIDGVAVIYISDDFQMISFLEVSINKPKKYQPMFDYLQERFGFT